MKKNLDISLKKPRYNEHVLPVPWPFVFFEVPLYLILFIFQKVAGSWPCSPSPCAGLAVTFCPRVH